MSPALAGPPTGLVGSTSGGDPYLPAAGNGGYQVRHYDLDLRYTPETKALRARARISAQTRRKNLRSFSLDLRGLAVCSVRVNGRPARLAETTVKTHVARILHKLGVRDRVQAVVLAHDSGLTRG